MIFSRLTCDKASAPTIFQQQKNNRKSAPEKGALAGRDLIKTTGLVPARSD